VWPRRGSGPSGQRSIQQISRGRRHGLRSKTFDRLTFANVAVQGIVRRRAQSFIIGANDQITTADAYRSWLWLPQRRARAARRCGPSDRRVETPGWRCIGTRRDLSMSAPAGAKVIQTSRPAAELHVTEPMRPMPYLRG